MPFDSWIEWGIYICGESQRHSKNQRTENKRVNTDKCLKFRVIEEGIGNKDKGQG